MNNYLKFATTDAKKYLYFNGSLPLDASRETFLKQVNKTTICNHLRLMYALSWHESNEVFRLILYCITDSKSIVGYLRLMKNNKNFDSTWWQQESINSGNPYLGGGEGFFL